MLPRVGFDWQRVNTHLDLRAEFIVQLQDAFYATYGRNVSIPKFDKEMAKVILRGTEMDESVTDVEPIEFWAEVKASFSGSGSFVENRRCTPQALHAFIAFAIEAREISIHSAAPNRPNAEGNLAKAVTSLLNEFAHEPYADTREDYYERAEAARWAAKTYVDEQKVDSDEETDNGEESEDDGEELKDYEEKQHEIQEHDEKKADVEEQDGEEMEGVECEADRLRQDFVVVESTMAGVHLDNSRPGGGRVVE